MNYDGVRKSNILGFLLGFATNRSAVVKIERGDPRGMGSTFGQGVRVHPLPPIMLSCYIKYIR